MSRLYMGTLVLLEYTQDIKSKDTKLIDTPKGNIDEIFAKAQRTFAQTFCERQILIIDKIFTW